MPKISLKGRVMPESPIRKLAPFAEQAKKRGVEVIHLNIGQPDIPTPDSALKAVREAQIEVLSYSPSEGTLAYRKKLAHYYQNVAIPVDETEIIVTTGGSEALSIAIGVVCDAEDELIVPEPFYANYNGFATANNVRVVPLPTRIEDNFALGNIEQFESLITLKTKAILLCNPGNPTGYVYSETELSQVLSLAKKHDIFVIVDEVYREFVYGVPFTSMLSLKGSEQHVILIDSVSKRYSMCGARIGCLVSKNKGVLAAALKFCQARLSPPTYAQIASEAALETPQSYFEAVNREYTQRRDVLMEALAKIPGVLVGAPSGAFYCMVALPVADADHFAQWMLSDFQDQGQTVMVAPGSGFYATPGQGKNQVRIAYVLEQARIKRAVELLAIALTQYPQP
jgi:aspartate aminotransferase